MKVLEQIHEIFNQYVLKPIQIPDGFTSLYFYLGVYPEKHIDYVPTKCTDNYLFNKYKQYIPDGWYGFAIGNPIVPAWCEIIDKILEVCIEADPEFEIHQIKLKYGEICFYVHSYIITDINEVESLISEKLFDTALVY